MPYTLPADMARQLLYLAGDKVDFDPWKKKLLEGGWMPRGGSGRSAGGGGVVQLPSPQRPGPGQTSADVSSLTELAARRGLLGSPKLPDQAAYEAAVQAQRSQNTPSFNPQMTNPYPSKPMAQSYQERQPIPIRPQSPADTAQTSFPSLPGIPKQFLELRNKMEIERFGRLLNEHERANLFKPGWEPPQ